MVNAAGILSIRAEDTNLDENVKRRVSKLIIIDSFLQINFLKYLKQNNMFGYRTPGSNYSYFVE